ncbi:MAG: VanW family protein [Clostridia bacterium]|nr:VanW family protein [Clostridia bacterium]MCL6521000.1 VanW family protein [Bacillota bacterium]
MLAAGGAVPRVERLLFGVRPGVTLDGKPMGGLLPGEVRARVQAMARAAYRPPRNARVEPGSGRILPEQAGEQVDVAATVRAVLDARAGARLRSVRLPVEPRITARLLRSMTRQLGSYRTWLEGSWERVHNIEVGAAALDNSLVLPGEVFSFWRALGEPTRARGYLEAPVISGEAFVPGVGGGLCQVSSTLYNAVLDAGLEVVERHGHSLAVDYVPPGRDATVAWDMLDFRFRNDSDGPVLVRARIEGWQLHVWILAPAQAPHAGAAN